MKTQHSAVIVLCTTIALSEPTAVLSSDAGENGGIEKYLGDYVQPGTTSCFQPAPNGGDVQAICDIKNSLSIHKVKNGTYEFSVLVYGANFHQCDASGAAQLKDNALEYRYKPSPPAESPECHLVFHLEDDGVRIEDPNRFNCFCGMRASLRNFKFSLKEKQK